MKLFPGCRKTVWLLSLLLLSFATTTNAQPALTFSKSFAPSTIGPGSTSKLTFNIVNNTASPASGLAFTDNLPAGMTIATPANAISTCGANGILSAVAGGSTISLTDGQVGANQSCTINVNIVGTATGTNTTGSLTSSLGNSGTASAILTVDSGRPGFSKNFSPGIITSGGKSTLTLTIDNTANTGAANSLSFTDNLPADIVIASPANASTNCSNGFYNGQVSTGISGGGITSFVSLAGGGVAAGQSCTVSVDVTSNNANEYVNKSGDLLSGFSVTSGFATAALIVTREYLSKSFTNDPVAPGGTVTLEFTINNFEDQYSGRDGTFGAFTSIAFTDDLAAVLPGTPDLVWSSVLSNDCGGTVSGAGTSLIDFSGGPLPPGQACTINVSVDVPAGASTGTYANTTSAITFNAGSNPVTGNIAADNLVIETAPLLTKEFIGDPVIAGGNVILRFGITNTSTSSAATDIAFIDELTTFFPFPVSVTLPTTPCGGGISLISLGINRQGLSLTGGTLAAAPGPGSSCTFDVTLDVPATTPNGTYVNTTGEVTATVGAVTISGKPATASFDVIAPPRLSKSFIDDPVTPGSQVTLEFTLKHSLNAPGDATNITFTDDLDAVLSGLEAASPLSTGSCNGTLSGTSALTYSGGSLVPGASCEFSVTLNVPSTAASGIYTNTTTNIEALVNGTPVTGSQATDDFLVTGLRLSKAFTDDPVNPGDAVTLEFTIANNPGSPDATNISFKDNLDNVLDNLTVDTPGSAGTCDGSLTATAGNTFLTYLGGSLPGGSSCTFSVTLNVPAGAAPDVYPNRTSDFSASFDGGTTTSSLSNASDNLIVAAPVSIVLSKSFDDDTPPGPGDNVTLKFTIGYDGLTGASAIAFTDTLENTIASLEMTAVNTNNCGGSVSGTSIISLADGSLSPGGSCIINVTLLVPLTATDGTFTNTTSSITATVGTLGINGSPATDDLTVVIVGESGRANNAPTADAGADTTVECASNSGTQVTLNGTGSSEPDGDALTFSWTASGITFDDPTSATPTATFPFGSTTVTLTVSDGDSTDTDEVIVTVEDTTPPEITLNGDNPDTLECHIDSYIEAGATIADICDPSPTLVITGTVDTSTPGTYTITYIATDASANSDTTTRTVEVVDTIPPVITMSSETFSIWPANHKYNTFALGNIVTTASDVCDVEVSAADVVISLVTSDEPEEDPGSGDGNTLDDIVIGPDCRSVDVRAERDGNGNGRVYTVNVQVADASGNVGTGVFRIEVPHDKKDSSIDDGPAYGVTGCSSQTAAAPIGGELITEVSAEVEIPAGYALEQNHPNPFNPSTTITFAVPKLSEVTLAIYNLQGQEIRTLHSGQINAGYHQVVWNGTDNHGNSVTSGIYFYVLKAGNFTQVKKMSLLK